MSNYKKALVELQCGLVRTQQALIASGARTILVLEGRDGAGKDGSIKRITEHLLPRNTRVVALPKPSDREQSQWYFQRYAAHLPAAGEFVIFNRSWYNRAGVETVMGFATPSQQAEFLRDPGRRVNSVCDRRYRNFIFRQVGPDDLPHSPGHPSV